MSDRPARLAAAAARALAVLAVAGLAGLVELAATPTASAQTVTIKVSSGAGGTVVPKGNVAVPVGGSQRFEIVPSAGYSIKSVVVDGRSQGTPTSYTLTDVRAPHTLKATFQVSTYLLTLTATDGFSVRPSTGGTLSVKHGKTVRFTITPAGGPPPRVTVDGQAVAVTSSAKGYTFSLRVTGPHRIVVGLPGATLSLQKSGTGSGTVVSNPAGIACGNLCSASFAQGKSITLTATPGAGSTFAGWTGGSCAGTNPVCAFNLAGDTTVTARFDAAIQQYSLTVAKSGAGTGSVSSNPAGIDCGADCSETYNAGQQVTLTAAPSGGSTFAGWSGGACAGTNPVCQLAMNAGTAVTAAFNPQGQADDQSIVDLANAGQATSAAAYSALEFAVRGVWEASTQAGKPTFTGTLTQVGSTEQFTYSPDPPDKLVGVFTSGLRIELRIGRFTGYTQGDWKDFMKSHDVAFDFYAANVANIHMESVTRPGQTVTYEWTRTYQGEMVFRNVAHAVNRTDVGSALNFSEEYDSSFESTEAHTGTMGTPAGTATIDDAVWSLVMNNFSIGRTARNEMRRSNSSAPGPGGTLKFQGLEVRWEAVTTVGDPSFYVSDPGYWYAKGSLLQGGVQYGLVQFDGPVTAYLTGPAVIVNLGGGHGVRLWKPIVGPGEQPVEQGLAPRPEPAAD